MATSKTSKKKPAAKKAAARKSLKKANREMIEIAGPAEVTEAYHQGSFTTTPSKRVRFFRYFFPWQFVRFIIVNIRMTLMILKSHSGK